MKTRIEHKIHAIADVLFRDNENMCGSHRIYVTERQYLVVLEYLCGRDIPGDYLAE